MYAQIFVVVAPILVVVILVAKFAPKIPEFGWKVMDVLAGAALTTVGGLVAFTSIYHGGVDPHIGTPATLAFALGMACTVVSMMYYWDHRK